MNLYFVAVAPHQELSDRIRLIQKDFADRFGSSKAFKNFPHITIVPPFKFDEINESEVIGHFQKAEIQTKPFEVELKKFSCFPNKKSPVIFIEPSNLTELKRLYQEINDSMKIYNYIQNFNPHLTVAYRDLTPENFEKAWKEYESKTIDEKFPVDKVTLYKYYNYKWNELCSRNL